MANLNAVALRNVVLAFILVSWISNSAIGQNPGFETTPVSSNGWTLESGSTTWTVPNTGAIRSGGVVLGLVSTTGNTRYARHTSGYTVSIPASGTNYAHVIGYMRAGTTGDAARMQAITAVGTNVLGTNAAFSSTNTWQRYTTSGLATNGSTYYPGFQVDGDFTSGGDNYRFDDIILYTSTSAAVDLTAPNSASALSALDNGTDIQLTWTDGTDAATNISGVEGTLIIRIAGDQTGSLPTPQPQTWYSTNTGIGPTTIVAGANTWTVLSNGASSGAFTNAGASGSDYTYVVYMRDKAFNYSAGTAFYCNNCTSLCTGTPAPGNTLVDDASPCIGANISLSLQNATTGNGVTYQWQRATDAGFTAGLTNLGTSSTQLTTSLTGSVYYRCQVTCTASASTGVSSPVNVISYACYCASGATDSQDGFIQRVRFNTIDQISPNSCQTYTNYTSVSTTAVIGSTYNLTINQSTCNANTGHRVRAWIDFNRDGIFSDPSERVFDADMGSFDPLQVTQSVTIPPDALPGPSQMRVVSRWGTLSNPQPCGTYDRGETEDYTLDFCEMIWVGYTTAWGTGSNWNCGVLPTAENKVVIPAAPIGGYFPTVNIPAANVYDITFEGDATIVIPDGNVLNVHGN